MIERFFSGGIIMWPLLAVALGIVALVVRASLQLSGGPAELPRARASLRSILFWGAMSLLLGLLGTVVGLLVMADALQRAGAASPSLVWGGVGVSLVSLVFGIAVLLFSGVAWVGLHRWSERVAGQASA
jgi:biopolymer transport protein ExbB/TolQ